MKVRATASLTQKRRVWQYPSATIYLLERGSGGLERGCGKSEGIAVVCIQFSLG